MSRITNNQQPTCGNAACGNQRLTIKNCLQECPNGGTATGKGFWSGEDNEVL